MFCVSGGEGGAEPHTREYEQGESERETELPPPRARGSFAPSPLLPALDLDFGLGLEVLGKLLPEETAAAAELENAAAAAAVPYMDDSSGDE